VEPENAPEPPRAQPQIPADADPQHTEVVGDGEREHQGEPEGPAAGTEAAPRPADSHRTEPDGGPQVEPAGEGRTRPDWARWRARGRLALFALAGAALALALAGRVSANVGPFDTTVAARPSWTGETVVRLSPLGTIGLDTHDWPLRLELQVDELGLDEAERIAENPQLVDQLGDDLAAEVRSALWRLALRCTLVALAGGLVGALVARLSWRAALGGLGCGALVVVSVGGGTAATFDAEAVAEPRYSGLLTVAPTAVGDVEAIVERFGEYRAQLSDLVSNIVTLYLVAEGLPTFEPTDGMVRLLHVSDVHLNPAAFDVMREVSDQFGVDAIVDTGDTTDWGTATEEAIVDEIGRLDVPYVWVRGNHDSRATQAAVASQPNATVLDGESTDVAGLRIWGIGDPRYTPNKQNLDDSESEQERADNFAPVVAERLVADEPPDVDIALVHDRRTAADLGGEVPLVLAGHTHEPHEDHLSPRDEDEGGDTGDGDVSSDNSDEANGDESEETLVLTEGSTGGAGLRGLQGDEPEPLTCTVLYFDPGTRQLIAYDRITVKGAGETGATIDRHVLPGAEAGADSGADTGTGGDADTSAGTSTTTSTTP
jgi:predicted phosphodiesterase